MKTNVGHPSNRDENEKIKTKKWGKRNHQRKN